MSEHPSAVLAAPSELPDHSGLLGSWDIAERRLRALGIAPAPRLRWLLPGVVAFAIGLAWIEHDATAVLPGVLLLCAGVGFVVVWAVLARRRVRAADAAVQARIASFSNRSFPVVGYASWLACDRPLFDVELRSPFDPELFEAAVRGVDPAIAVRILDDRRARIAIPALVAPRYRASTSATRRAVYGNVPLLRRLFDEVLLPLNDDNPIVRVEMGGLVGAPPP